MPFRLSCCFVMVHFRPLVIENFRDLPATSVKIYKLYETTFQWCCAQRNETLRQILSANRAVFDKNAQPSRQYSKTYLHITLEQKHHLIFKTLNKSCFETLTVLSKWQSRTTFLTFSYTNLSSLERSWKMGAEVKTVTTDFVVLIERVIAAP